MPQTGACRRINLCLRSGKAFSPLDEAQLGHHEYALAAPLLIEDAIGLLRFRELPTVSEQVFDRDFPVGDETCTIGLPDL